VTSSASSSPPSRLALQRLAAGAVTVLALAVLLNGSLLSAWGANHVDLSINLTAAHALRHGDVPYGLATLRDRAEALASPTDLIYSQLFTSYIQPPTSALTLLPLTMLPWRDATHLYLVLNHLFLGAAVALTLLTLRPALPPRWLIAGAAVVVAAYAQINASFALGQVDASLLFLIAIGFWGYTRSHPAVAGIAIAFAAAIKLIPALLLLYFLWKRDYRAFFWGIGTGLALFLASLAYVGADIYDSYLTDTLPAVLKGSSHYSNASLGAAIARWRAPDLVGGIAADLSLSEVPSDSLARLASAAVSLAALIGLALLIPRRTHSPTPNPQLPTLWEYYLVAAAGLLISSVTWEFYVIWLLPVFLAAFLAPETLAGGPRLLLLPAFALALFALNYPGDCGSSLDCYLFEPNGFLYHPAWVPAVWLERQVGLYANHLDAVLYLRLAGLLLLTGCLALLVLVQRKPAPPGEEGRDSPRTSDG
jgi:alpha-1,2-mannosyltransferase